MSMGLGDEARRQQWQRQSVREYLIVWMCVSGRVRRCCTRHCATSTRAERIRESDRHAVMSDPASSFLPCVSLVDPVHAKLALTTRLCTTPSRLSSWPNHHWLGHSPRCRAKSTANKHCHTQAESSSHHTTFPRSPPPCGAPVHNNPHMRLWFLLTGPLLGGDDVACARTHSCPPPCTPHSHRRSSIRTAPAAGPPQQKHQRQDNCVRAACWQLIHSPSLQLQQQQQQ